MIHLAAAEVIYNLRDASGSVAQVVLHMGADTDLTTARAAMADMAARLELISRCVVHSYGITYTSIVSPPAPGGGRKERRGLFILGAGTEDTYGVAVVPGIIPALVAVDNTIDPAQPAVSAFIAELSYGLWCNPFGNDLTGLEASYLQFVP